MPKKLHKHLKIYLSKLKKIPNLSLPNPNHATNSLLSACKYPKTPSFAVGRDNNGNAAAAATLTDIDHFLFENFNSLYLHDEDEKKDGVGAKGAAGIKPTDRFFVSPGRTSSSLADESTRTATTSSTQASSSEAEPTKDGVAVTTLSKDPYNDFLLSMQEMVESRHASEQAKPLDWDFMEELLFCYLELNDKSVHKHILKAFTDLTASYRRKAPAAERRKVAAAAARRMRRRRRKACREIQMREEEREQKPSPSSSEEKVKDCYYEKRSKHM